MRATASGRPPLSGGEHLLLTAPHSSSGFRVNGLCAWLLAFGSEARPLTSLHFTSLDVTRHMSYARVFRSD